MRTITYWISTTLFCLQMSFTAYAQLRLPQVAQAWGWAAGTAILWALSYVFWRLRSEPNRSHA